MTDTDIAPYLWWFEDFTARFKDGDPEDAANIELKREHSLRVLDNARAIVGRLGRARPLSARADRLVLIAALFHDLGRFPQYRQYRTFQDAYSENHAHLGVRALKEHRVLQGLPERDRRLVMAAVSLHNRRSVPPGLPPLVSALTYVVRDADKLDIFKILLEHMRPGTPHNDVVFMHLTPDTDRYSDHVYQQAMGRKMVDYTSMVWVNDFKILLLSWLYDLRYPASLELLSERGLIEELVAYLPDVPAMHVLADRIRDDLANALASGADPAHPFEDREIGHHAR